MTLLDIVLLIFIGWFGFLGFKNGLVYEIACVLALVLGCWMAYHFSDWVAMLIIGTHLAKPISMVFTFIVVLLLIRFAGRLFSKIIKLAIPGSIDHIFGLLFGICKVLVTGSVILFILQDIDKKGLLLKNETKEKSITYQYVEPIVPNAMNWESTQSLLPNQKEDKQSIPTR